MAPLLLMGVARLTVPGFPGRAQADVDLWVDAPRATSAALWVREDGIDADSLPTGHPVLRAMTRRRPGLRAVLAVSWPGSSSSHAERFLLQPPGSDLVVEVDTVDAVPQHLHEADGAFTRLRVLEVRHALTYTTAGRIVTCLASPESVPSAAAFTLGQVRPEPVAGIAAEPGDPTPQAVPA